MAKQYQLIIFGATGFTGRLAALYMAKQYAKDNIKWAIAGRSATKLAAICAECEAAGTKPSQVVCDSSNEAAVKEMVESTEVIVTTAGPFARYGSPIVEACARSGTHYCDITGETPWVREMIGLYDDVAKASGARIVHFCGHDCVPWDLMTMMLVKRLRETNPQENLATVDHYNTANGRLSGGTVETMMGLLFGEEKNKPRRDNLTYDGLLKCGDQASNFKLKIANVTTFQAGTNGQPMRSNAVMAGVNANAVRRSNALLGYGEGAVYSEGMAFENRCHACIYFSGLAAFGLGLMIPPVRWLLRRFVLPKPGEGPSDEQMAAGFLTVTGVAKGTAGGDARATMHFNGDPGYKETSRMLVESGLALALEGKSIKCGGGVYTPAACQGEVLLNRLIKTGTTFSFHDAAQ